MSPHDHLGDDDLDALLDGSVPPGAIETRLAAHLARLRADAEATAPAATAALASVLEDGLDLAEVAPAGILTFSSHEAVEGILTASADEGILTRGILTIRARGRAIARVLVTQFAALGLLSKAAVAGATVAVATASAGAAGVLPPPAQVAFDDAVGRQVEQVEDTDESTRDTGVVGGDVADDATGADGEPGVVGRDVADDASDGRAGGAAGAEASEGRAGGTAAEDAGSQAEDAGSQAEDAGSQAEDAGSQADDAASERPDAPTERATPGRRGGGSDED